MNRLIHVTRCQNCKVLFEYLKHRFTTDKYICPNCKHLNYNDNIKGKLPLYEVFL